MAGETSNSIDEGAGDPLAALPEAVREGLTEAQRAAIAEALGAGRWRRHPIDIRLSLPLVHSRYCITIVAGRERRSGARRSRERDRHPLRTTGNLAFLLIVVATLYGSAVLAALVWSAILEF